MRVLSGIQPTGIPHLGNYLGALKNWKVLQKDHEAFYSIVDLHAITVPQEPLELKKSIREMAMAVIASGIDPKKAILFRQSRVKEHTELGWILSCQTPLPWLQRMHQFKTKGDKMLGLLSYPVLQAADILLYQANIVPVGQDQSQHMNLTTDIAKSFNSKYGNVFVVPKGMYGTTQSMRIMSLREPVKKMSKSDKTEMSRIDIIDSAEVIKTKIRKATTDSIQGVTYDPNRPGIANLLDIYFAIQETSGTVEELNSIVVKEFGSKTTRELKEIVGDCVIDHLEPIRTRYQELQRNQDEIDLILEDGECKAREIAQETMDRVSTALGLK